MKLDANAVTPRFAKRFQNGTEPSAKSSQSGGLPVKSEQFACSRSAGARELPRSAKAAATATATARTASLFTGNRVAPSLAVLTNALRFQGPGRFPPAPALALSREAVEACSRARCCRSRRRGGDRIGFGQLAAGHANSRTDVGGCRADLRAEVRRLSHARRDRTVLTPQRSNGGSACERDPRDDEARADAAMDAGP